MSGKKLGLDNPAFERGSGDLESGNGKPPAEKVGQEKCVGDESRATWGNGLEFLMSCIAMSVGLGNIWRFPFTAYENGGGAFLIPYIIILIVIGRPLYYMEMGLGQFSSRGNVKTFEALAPALKGIGYGQLVGSISVATYYCSLMAITLFYLVNSFTAHLPWVQCQEEWQSENDLLNLTCVSADNKNSTAINNSISSSELWFTREVLKLRTDVENGIGAPEWRLTLCLFASWAVAFVVSRRGVKSSGKASYFLAIFPYVVMFALLIRAATLEGAGEGILYFIRPEWEKLAKADVWYAAVTQCFFSLNVGFGTIIMYSSYNSFEHNINRDALVVTTLDTFTSLLAGATIFGILGNLAHELNVDLVDVINSGGTGLAFVSYPDAIAKFEAVPWLFAILFFVMLFVLGVGSLIALQGCSNVVILDNFPHFKSWQVTLATSILGFIIGLVYVTPGGQFILTLVDFFGGTFVVFAVAIFEVVGIMWWYGLENFCIDLEFMLKRKVGVYWRMTWGLITPSLLIIIFIYFLATVPKLKYGPYELPEIALVFGWLILVIGVVQIPLWVFYYVCTNPENSFTKSLKKAFQHDDWGPRDAVKREEWKKFRSTCLLYRDQKPWLKRTTDSLLGRD